MFPHAQHLIDEILPDVPDAAAAPARGSRGADPGAAEEVP